MARNVSDRRERAVEIKETMRRNAEHYKQVTLKVLPDDKFAAAISVSAVLRDSAGNEDNLFIGLLLLGPRKPIVTRMLSAK